MLDWLLVREFASASGQIWSREHLASTSGRINIQVECDTKRFRGTLSCGIVIIIRWISTVSESAWVRLYSANRDQTCNCKRCQTSPETASFGNINFGRRVQITFETKRRPSRSIPVCHPTMAPNLKHILSSRTPSSSLGHSLRML
jgi:hypothetical protein